MEQFNIALLGYGTVGTGVYSVLRDNHSDIQHRENLNIQVRKIFVRDKDRAMRRLAAPEGLFTCAIDDVLSDPDIHIVAECMGGVEPARSYILSALKAGKTVVTANKEVISKHWFEFEEAAKDTGAGLYFEATVGGGIPILRTINDSMQANNITRVMGIINGTTNYILSRMEEEGISFEEALSEAQRLGYAEADPTADVEGFDAMYKLSILSSMAFHAHMPIEVIQREGITKLSRADFEAAKLLGYRIKLLAIGKKTGREIEARVHPTMLPQKHPLASVGGVFNAVQITGSAVEDVMLYGRGAGRFPTASAVVSDIVYACHAAGRHRYMTFQNGRNISEEIELVSDFSSIYCVRLCVLDRPGTLAAVAAVFAQNDVSLREVLQLNGSAGECAHITFVTHQAREASVQKALEAIKALPVVQAVESVIRAEE